VCGEQQRIVDQAKAQGNAWDTGVVPGPRIFSGGAEFHDCRRSDDESAALESWATSVLTMGQPIDANEPPVSSACREDHPPFAVPSLHGQVTDAMTNPLSSFCYQLDPDASCDGRCSK
jgi:hypothetical protein